LYLGEVHVAEVNFYFSKTTGGETQAFALLSLYSPPDEHLLQHSHNTLIVCRYQGEETLVIIDVKSILSVVAMVPFRYAINGLDNYYFMIEKIGLDVVDTDADEDE
jgi:hypothetical protein